MPINPEIAQKLGKQARIRVCGMVIENEKVLLINHHGLYDHDFWSFPGGGLEYGESAAETLIREFQEECNLGVLPGELAFTCEVYRPPLHALELIFNINKWTGIPEAGYDPERGKNQIISDLRLFTWDEVGNLKSHQKHPIFNRIGHPSAISSCKGYHYFPVM